MTAGKTAISSVLLRLEDSWPLGMVAREFACAGVPIFPCAPGGKRPLTRRGFQDASTDLERVQFWWDRAPSANIGLPTGAASGLVVVDVDVHGPVNGFEGFNRAHRAGLVSGWEFLARSPSGGMHVYFPAVPEAVQRSWQVARAGIDFRGDGGYIVVPPSARNIDGHRVPYSIEQVARGETAPVHAQRLRDFLDPRPVIPRPESRYVGTPGALSELADRVARLQEGERNLGLFKAACRLAENGTPPGEALAVLGAAAGQAGLGEREITRTVRSAYGNVNRFGPRHRPSPARQGTGTFAPSRPRSSAVREM